LATIAGEPSCVLSAFQLFCAAIANSPQAAASTGSGPTPALPYAHAPAHHAPAHHAPAHHAPSYAPSPAHAHAHVHAPAPLPFQGAPGTITVLMNVADDAVGRVIGKAGSTVAEIRTLTSCQIHVARKEPMDSHRVVTISGLPDSVKLAQTLIIMKQSSPQPVATLMQAALASTVAGGGGSATSHGLYSSSLLQQAPAPPATYGYAPAPAAYTPTPSYASAPTYGSAVAYASAPTYSTTPAPPGTYSSMSTLPGYHSMYADQRR